MEIESAMVSLPGEGRPMPAQLARPKGSGQFPGILVIMEGGGMTEQVQDVARRLAREGYMTLAPEFFYRLAGTIPSVPAARNEYLKDKAWDTQLMSDVRLALTHLKSQGATKLGCTGFCWGGRATYLAAAYNPDIVAAVPFYGVRTGSTARSVQAPIPPHKLIRYTSGAVLAFFGDQDQHIPLEEVQRVQSALKSHNITHELHLYKGAGHGFFRDGSSSYHPASAADAWEKTKGWFKKYLA